MLAYGIDPEKAALHKLSIMKKPAENIWNASNILTILRIALVPMGP